MNEGTWASLFLVTSSDTCSCGFWEGELSRPSIPDRDAGNGSLGFWPLVDRPESDPVGRQAPVVHGGRTGNEREGRDLSLLPPVPFSSLSGLGLAGKISFPCSLLSLRILPSVNPPQLPRHLRVWRQPWGLDVVHWVAQTQGKT